MHNPPQTSTAIMTRNRNITRQETETLPDKIDTLCGPVLICHACFYITTAVLQDWIEDLQKRPAHPLYSSPPSPLSPPSLSPPPLSLSLPSPCQLHLLPHHFLQLPLLHLFQLPLLHFTFTFTFNYRLKLFLKNIQRW